MPRTSKDGPKRSSLIFYVSLICLLLFCIFIVHSWKFEAVFSLNEGGFLGFYRKGDNMEKFLRCWFGLFSFLLLRRDVSFFHFFSLGLMFLGILGNMHALSTLGAIPDIWCLSCRDYCIHFNLPDILLIIGGFFVLFSAHFN